MDITYQTGTYGDEPGTLHTWRVSDDHGVAAELYVSIDRREIIAVEVREDRQREGLATALYHAADQQIGIYHAPVAHRTPEGHAFAVAVGGDTAEYPCDCYGCTTIEED